MLRYKQIEYGLVTCMTSGQETAGLFLQPRSQHIHPYHCITIHNSTAEIKGRSTRNESTAYNTESQLLVMG